MSRTRVLPRTRVLAHARVRAAVVAALLAPLAACSSSSSPSAPDTKVKPSADDRPVTVTVTPKGEQVAAGEPVRVTAAGADSPR